MENLTTIIILIIILYAICAVYAYTVIQKDYQEQIDRIEGKREDRK